jgi:ribonuclease-3
VKLERLQRQLNYTFQDESLLINALTHRSAGSRNNERLEFLGDSILGFEVADQLFQIDEKATEGQLSRMRAYLVKRETLAEIAREYNLGDLLFLGTGELKSGGQNRDSILADAIEAIIAAVYLDGGMELARGLVRHFLGDRLANPSTSLKQKDPKTQLQEYLQSQGLALPSYEVDDISGDQHKQTFYVICQIESQADIAKGQGISRRKAEQAAAQAMLDMLKVEPEIA